MLISNGFEEIEAIASADIVMRGGVAVEICSITHEKEITGAHQMKLFADSVLADIVSSEEANKIAEQYDGVILPGGQPNAGTLRDDERVIRIVKAFYNAGKITSAICASPCVLEKAGILQGKKATSFPDCINPDSCAEYRTDRAVRDGNLITGRAAGTTIDFALEILRGLDLSEAAAKIKEQIFY